MADPYGPAAFYPNVVALTAILASPCGAPGRFRTDHRSRLLFERINTEGPKAIVQLNSITEHRPGLAQRR